MTSVGRSFPRLAKRVGGGFVNGEILFPHRSVPIETEHNAVFDFAIPARVSRVESHANHIGRDQFDTRYSIDMDFGSYPEVHQRTNELHFDPLQLGVDSIPVADQTQALCQVAW